MTVDTFSCRQKEVLTKLSVNAAQGLSKEEAQAAPTLWPQCPEGQKEKNAAAALFLDQFMDVMILILIAAAVVSFVVALGGHDAKGIFEPLLILLIVILNAILGVFQENKAERALDALKSLSAPPGTGSSGWRGTGHRCFSGGTGRHHPGGGRDFIPADARLLESASLKSEESALTGESVPAEKDAAASVEENTPLGDRINMMYSDVPSPMAVPKEWVTATGMDTEMGKIAGLLEGKKRPERRYSRSLPSWANIWDFWPWAYAPLSLWWVSSTASP